MSSGLHSNRRILSRRKESCESFTYLDEACDLDDVKLSDKTPTMTFIPRMGETDLKGKKVRVAGNSKIMQDRWF